MKHDMPRIKFELGGDLIIVDRNGPDSYTAKLFEPLAGGDFETRPLCRFTNRTPAQAARGVIKARNACYQARCHYADQARHDDGMAEVWRAQGDES